MKSVKAFTIAVLIIVSCFNSFGQALIQKKQTENNNAKNKDMENENYTSTILVTQSATAAFNDIKNLRAWWSEEIEGETDKLNATFFYHYKDVHLCKIKLIEIVPDKKVVYQVIDNQFSFVKDKTEWINTKLVFDITTEDGKTKIQFTHQGLTPDYECYNVCHDAWTSYIQGSLQNLITTGRGKPNGKEGGLNAELVKKWGLPDNPNKSNTMKKEKDFTTSILVDKTPAEVYKAINNARDWWQGEFDGKTDKLDREFTYQVPGIHFSKQKVIELIPGKKVVWLVTESNLSFVAKHDEWTNTTIQFDISSEGKKTKITFTHSGLVPAFECYGGCSGAWEALIEKSLLSFITTGKGVKVF
jgi:uncharacterized protein YndB with AHSA1/START domain